MELLMRPAASEVRTLLQKIKLENIERGLSLASAGIERKFEPVKKSNNNLQGPVESIEHHPLSSGLNKKPFETSFETSFANDDLKNCFRAEEDLDHFLSRCSKELEGLPSPLKRNWKKPRDLCQEISSMFGYKREETGGETVRVLQWNVLSQSLGTKNDNFERCPIKALNWNTRRFRMLEEIARHDPDLVCLQEVDHFTFLQKSLATLGYVGFFKPKPDSPCLHLSDNTGPDGCAIFYKKKKFEMKKIESRVLEIWGVPSNQVALSMMLKSRTSGSEFVISTTHLKARKGPLMSALRNEQAKDLLDHLTWFASGKPIICSGDFNAEPNEPVYATITHPDELGLSSAYCKSYRDREVDYTSWKIRGDEECKEILDYIFYSQNGFEVEAVLEPVAEEELGEDRLPNLAFASDHLSLVTDLKLAQTQANNIF